MEDIIFLPFIELHYLKKHELITFVISLLYMDHAQTFCLYQPLLHTIAYNLVRCKQDAEDIVQETFVKWLSIDHEKIENTKAYLIRAVTNNCLNHLQTLKRKKEECLDNLAESFHRFKEMNFSHLDLEIHLSVALQVINTKLEPLERAVYLLKEVFDFDYETLQKTFDKKQEHCRQLFCRAKKKLEEETARVTLPEKSKLFENFKKACDFGNASDLISELKNDIAASIRNNF
jgi:RNA polymerase sigma factor (sigma-70 family)